MANPRTGSSSQVTAVCAGVPAPRHAGETDDVADPLLDCMDCGELFRFSSSIDEDRCDHCATRHALDLGREVSA